MLPPGGCGTRSQLLWTCSRTTAPIGLQHLPPDRVCRNCSVSGARQGALRNAPPHTIEGRLQQSCRHACLYIARLEQS